MEGCAIVDLIGDNAYVDREPSAVQWSLRKHSGVLDSPRGDKLRYSCAVEFRSGASIHVSGLL
jgi:hypothetical protein